MNNSETLRGLIAKPFIDRARHAACRGRYSEAEQYLENAKRLRPQSPDAVLLIAKIRLREGRLHECREALLEARRLGHLERESDQMLRWLEDHAGRRADTLQKHPVEAASQHARASQGAPQLKRLGTTKDLLRSIAQLRTYLTSQPSCAIGLARMAEAIARKSVHWNGSSQMLDEAEALAMRAITISPTSSEGHASLGFVYGIRGAALDAERKLRQAIEIDECHWFALHGLGRALLHRGLHEQGAQLLARSIAVQPLFIPNYYAMHHACHGFSDHEGSIQALDVGIARANEQVASDAGDLQSHAYLAILLARKGLHSESRKVAIDTTDRFPKSGFAWAHRAITHAVSGDSDEAISSLIAARERDYDTRLVVGLAEFDPLRNSSSFSQVDGD